MRANNSIYETIDDLTNNVKSTDVSTVWCANGARESSIREKVHLVR